MRTRGALLALATILGLAFAAQAHAQATPYELNVHVGALSLEDADDTDLMVGARIMLQYPSGWGWGGNIDWVALDEFGGPGGEDVDLNLYLYSFEIDYTFSPGSQLRPFVGGGIGAATFKLSDAPEGVEDSDTEVLVPLAGGVKWFDQPTNPSWAIRGEVRDNIIFNESDGDGDDGASNNWEFSGGVSFFF
ncbi:MAG: outer membrane beta-barrel protein [Gemmatimonadota bacterium]|nr:outer membrane beta-barrel protein [Gemmatimonadota bacterium]